MKTVSQKQTALDLAPPQVREIFTLTNAQKKIADENQLALGLRPTPQQIELFKYDRLGYDWAESFFAKLPRPSAEYFRKLYNKKIKRHLKFANGGFSGAYAAQQKAREYTQAVLMPRINQVLAQYTHIVAITNHNINNAEYILRTLERPSGENGFVKSNRKPLYLYTKNEIDRFFAIPLAGVFSELVQRFADNHAGSVEDTEEEMRKMFARLHKQIGEQCEELFLELPYWSKAQRKPLTIQQMQSDIAKACDVEYWNKKLNRHKKHMAEHIAIATGQVNKNSSPYASYYAIQQDKIQQRKNYDFLKSQILINIDNPEEQVELFESCVRSISNPKIRRIELMNKLRGVEEWAQENGHEAYFLTLTAPSKYHAYKSTSGKFNDKWNGSSPKQTQAYLCQQWAKMRAKWKRQDIKYYGLRVVEPHHDGTPHWHILVYLEPQEAQGFLATFKQYAMEIDGDEAGAKDHRYKVEKCDPNRGSATAYITKYISKNINGYALDGETDDETGEDLKDTSSKATVWAKLWRIRQFQDFGLPPMTVWREVRRLGDKKITKDDRLETLRAVVDVGDFACYIREQGGTNITRAELLARPAYEECEISKYFEPRKKIYGIYNQLTTAATELINAIKTRLKNWAVIKRPQDWVKGETVQFAQEQSNTQAADAATWTCVSNCTRSKNKQIGDVDEKTRNLIREQLTLIRGRVTEYQIDEFLSGKPLKIPYITGAKVYAKWVNGQIVQETLLN